MVSRKIAAIVAMVLLIRGVGVHAIVIETVPVGNPGNAADTEVMNDNTTGYGSVDYPYNIGKYEVTAGQYTAFLNAVAGVDTYGLYNTYMWTTGSYGCKIERYTGDGTSGNPYQYRVAADWANRPVNCVSWGNAARFANWLHNGQPTGVQDASTTEDGAYYLNGATSNAALLAVNRKSTWKWAITSEDEWYKAAYYDPATSSYFDYPTSSNSVPSYDLIDPDPGNNANFNLGYTIGSPYWRTEVGEFENSDSPYGTFDQGGNVWEWNEGIVSGSFRGLRGGSFYGYDTALRASNRYSNSPTYVYHTHGFRVSEVPEIVAPGKATSPNPSNGATGVSITTTLSWTAGSGATSHKVYFGTSNPPTYKTTQTGTAYDPGTMIRLTVYYWRIDEVNASGTTTGDLWQFTTRSAPGDFDADEDVDLVDFGHLQGCYGGEGVAPVTGCTDADLEGDGDVDQTDFNIFRNCFGGADRPPGC